MLCDSALYKYTVDIDITAGRQVARLISVLWVEISNLYIIKHFPSVL